MEQPTFEQHEPVREQRETERHDEPFRHEAPSAPPPQPVATEAEPPRRRSTVREPAPASVGNESHTAVPAPPEEAPQPVVISSDEPEEAARPRRSGWWSKRVLGKG